MNKTKAKVIAKKLYDNGLNATKTVKELKPYLKNQHTIEQTAHRLLNNPEVKRELEELLSNVELDKEKIIENVKELINAKLITVHKGQEKLTELPDNRIKAKLILKLLDIFYGGSPSAPPTTNIYIDKYLNMTTEQLEQERIKLLKENKEIGIE